MGLAVLVLLIALALGALLGGRVSGLPRLPVRHLPWLGGAFALQLAGALITEATVHQLALLASAALAVRFAAGNLHLAGIPLAAAGLLLNALVIVVNGGMPLSGHAAARAGVPLDRPGEAGRIAAGPDTRLNALGESVPVPLPMRPEVDSPGDLLVAAGIGLLVVDGMLYDRRAPGFAGFAGFARFAGVTQVPGVAGLRARVRRHPGTRPRSADGGPAASPDDRAG